MATRNGFDGSHYQGPIDFDKVIHDDDNIKFGIFKATQGTTYIDPQFARNMAESERVGLDNGAYHFATFRSVPEAIKQAEFFVSVAGAYKLEEGFVLDLESNPAGLGRDALTDAAIAFMDRVKQLTNGIVKLYINKNFYDNYLDMSRIIGKYEVWGARYSSASGMDNLAMWQYSDKGHIDGISGYVDMDIDYVFDSSAPNTPANVPSTPVVRSKRSLDGNGRYTVQNGDTLSEIASDLGIKMSDLQKWNHITDPNLIRVGQVLNGREPVTAAPIHVPTETYVVRAGDTLSEIAMRYHTSVSTLQTLNGIHDKDFITVGQRLIVTAPKANAVQMVTVRSGDTVSELAVKYHSSVSQIKAWNNLNSKCTIYIGQKLRVK